MPPRQELMERLAAADPLRDGEQLAPEERREADALLARLVATPVRPEGDRPASRLRRRALAVAAAACAVVAATAAIDLLDAEAPAPGVVDRAVAAVTRGGVVYHVLEYRTSRESPPADDAGPRESLVETWTTSDGRLHHKAFVVRDGRKGRLVEDFAGRRRPGRAGGAALRWDGFTNRIHESGFSRADEGVPSVDSFGDPGARLRSLQQAGRLRVAGTTSVDGRRAYRLLSEPITVRDSEVEVEFTVDAESYLPLSQHVSTEVAGGRSFEWLTRYRIYERLPLDEETDRLLGLDPHPGAKCSEFAHELTQERDLGFPNPCRAGGSPRRDAAIAPAGRAP